MKMEIYVYPWWTKSYFNIKKGCFHPYSCLISTLTKNNNNNNNSKHKGKWNRNELFFALLQHLLFVLLLFYIIFFTMTFCRTQPVINWLILAFEHAFFTVENHAVCIYHQNTLRGINLHTSEQKASRDSTEPSMAILYKPAVPPKQEGKVTTIFLHYGDACTLKI